jgi:hypothetical protein
VPFLLLLFAAAASDDSILQELFSNPSARVRIPPRVYWLRRPLVIPEGTAVDGIGATFRMSPRFRGRAMIECRSGVTLSGLALEGSLRRTPRRLPLAPPENAYVRYYDRFGVLVHQADNVRLDGLRLTGFDTYPVLVSDSDDFYAENLTIADSGSLNKAGMNNASGGLLIEEGSARFTVRRCTFARVRGNALWTHSLYTSRRNGPGEFRDNQFREIGRDAIQVGHATRIRVSGNSGARIGYPTAIVDLPGGGTPVAIDTAGNVDLSTYEENTFLEVNGKCLDLDGFHRGAVIRNRCTNSGAAVDYPHGHYGIVLNNTNPDMRSEQIEVENNVIDGAKYGGIYLMGERHRVRGNRFLRLNLAGCNQSAAQFGCLYDPSQPDLLRSGIYLGKGPARPEPSLGILIEDNLVTGHGMAEHCIAAAPGVKLADQTIQNNTCRN